jgi:VanZ family protein
MKEMRTAVVPTYVRSWRNQVRPYWKSILWAIIIMILSAAPGRTVPEVPVWNFDKLVHIAMYWALALFLYADLKRCPDPVRSDQKALSLAISLSIVYGGVIELLQNYAFVDRSGSWLDFLANGAGAILLAICVYLSRKRRIDNVS